MSSGQLRCQFGTVTIDKALNNFAFIWKNVISLACSWFQPWYTNKKCSQAPITAENIVNSSITYCKIIKLVFRSKNCTLVCFLPKFMYCTSKGGGKRHFIWANFINVVSTLWENVTLHLATLYFRKQPPELYYVKSCSLQNS